MKRKRNDAKQSAHNGLPAALAAHGKRAQYSAAEDEAGHTRINN
jgi:hypothetical protein